MTINVNALEQRNVISQGIGLPEPPQNLSIDEERTLRKQELAAAFRIFAKFGFAEGVTGHITARDPEYADCFWINPFAMTYAQIKASDLILVDEAGNVVEGHGAVNMAGFYIHSAVHQARPEVVAAAHTHSLYGKALSSLGVPLLPITQDATAFYGDHSVYDYYGGVAGYYEEGNRIATALDANKAAILQNHGLITVGRSVGEAAWWFITMERSCQAQLLAMAAGTPIEIDDETARQAFEDVGTEFAGWLSFRPLWDQIIRAEPELLD